MVDLVSRKAGAAHRADAIRLVNLTEHDIAVQSQTSAPPGDDGASADPGVLSLPPEGTFARVDDVRAALGEDWLTTGDGWVRLTRLRRSTRVIGLPDPQPGIRYVVSRLTALAAGSRPDLVFPFGEIRDARGRVTGVRGLAQFPGRWSPAQSLRAWRARARERLAGRPLSRQWLTGVLFATGTALLSGAIGLLPGAIDNAQRSGWGGGGQFWTAWLTVAFGALGGALLLAGAWRWRRRGQALEERGTAYVIEEQAINWRREEKESVLAALRAEFARVLHVPGPEALGADWRWQADASGAPHWDARVDELVRSFWAVHYNDDQVTRNAVFTWAPWPVAMAFGARATGRRRGLVLHVRQRPTYGAQGPMQKLNVTEGACDFLRTPPPGPLRDSAPDHTLLQVRERLPVTFQVLDQPNGPAPAPAAPDTGGGSRGAPAGTAGAGALLLMIRLVEAEIGPIPLDVAQAAEVTVNVPASLAGTVIPLGTRIIPVAEWRLTSSRQPPAPVPWKAFPAAAEAIAGWVSEQADAHAADVVLLATRIPQELAVGLGIQLAQRGQTWPRRMFPVFYTSGQLVIPDLRLGSEAVPPERP